LIFAVRSYVTDYVLYVFYILAGIIAGFILYHALSAIYATISNLFKVNGRDEFQPTHYQYII